MTTQNVNKDIAHALKVFKEKISAVETAWNYYNGKHDLRFASDRFINAFGKLFSTFSLNVCPAVCDALRDKLVVDEFRIEAGSSDSLREDAWKIWQSNRMEIRSGEVHKEAAIAGDAYVIVWPDSTGKVTIYPQRSSSCIVVYDDETPGKISWAAKLWLSTETKRFRLNLYYPDRIERYVSKKEKNQQGTIPDAKGFEEFEKPIPNPYDVVPVFHFANNGSIGGDGCSELRDARPLQDALNKSVLDMLVTMEFQAYRQRWASGIEINYDSDGKPVAPFEAGITSLWVTETEGAKFGDFASTDLKQFLEVQDAFKVNVAIVTGTPIYFFIQSGANFPSGESLKKAETRFINKVIDRQKVFGAAWADVMAFALLIENKGKDLQIFTEWQDPAPLTEKENLENLLIKADLNVSETQLLTEAGYGEEDIKKMLEENAAKAQAAVDRFNAGEGIGDEGQGTSDE